MADLTLLIPSLQRFVAPPGLFETLFPDATDEDLVGSLADGFAECQLKGFFSESDLDVSAIPNVTPDLTNAQGSLVVLFSGVRILQSEIRNRKSHIRQEAPGLVNEVDQASQVLTELLKEYQAEKKELIDQASRVGASSVFVMADAYYINATTRYSTETDGGLGYRSPYGGLL